ncbi:MAG TPA: YceI family protein [Candidatus Competibacteraceae bacterium]|nr:YceI family protein [Candidatus Competibacteraceae bacterium]
MKPPPAALTPLLGLLLGLLLTTLPVRAEPQRYRLDPEHTSIGFLVFHIGYERVLGLFRKSEGSFVFDEDSGELRDVRIVIDTDSVFTNHDKRDQHLRSKDFLNSAQYPQMIFTAATAERTGARSYKIHGDLTLIGKTRPLTLDFTWNKSGDYPLLLGGAFKPYVTGMSGRGVIKRSEFGMTYGVDNGWVGDEIELIIEFEAQRQ